MNMRKWLQELLTTKKQSLPVLSFPGIAFTKDSVTELVKSGEKQAACMAAIAEHYKTSASVSLMDLSVEAECFGCTTLYRDNEVPTITGTLVHTFEEAEKLTVPKVGAFRSGECIRGIREAKKKIQDRPVFAGIIGPYSLAGRLCDMTEILMMCLDEPETVDMVLGKATEFLIQYAKELKAAGADGIIIAEPAAGLLSPALMEQFSNPYVEKMIQAVQGEDFLICYHNCASIVPLLHSIAKLPADMFSIGNAIDIEEALKVLPERAAVIGNIDPSGVLLAADEATVYQKTAGLIKRCSGYSNFVIGSGCDIPPLTPHRNLQAFFRAVAEA